ncbi:hypothetical protein [Bacillus sp. 03113]|uniref:hypothetical protein n=1 Tax=Bacillus sp. 03113 TaxID=2578211 RepID=UPI00215BDD74|nr:hypothetical protein [Bacillus sp. 03113]
MIELTAAHWAYAIVTIAVIITMLMRKGVVLPTLIGTFLVAVLYKSSIIGGFQAVFNASLIAAKELFNIFLIITVMVALLKSLKDIGADQKMIAPIEKVMKNSYISFFIIIAATYVISLFFWPTPAVPLICTLLLPAAVRSGMSPMMVAITVSIAGQGMALSSDYIMKVAPMLTAKAAGIETAPVADKVLVLSLITGGTALLIAFIANRKSFVKSYSDEALHYEKSLMSQKSNFVSDEIAAGLEDDLNNPRKELWGKIFAVVVPVSLLAVMIFMFSHTSGGRFAGGDGAAFIGGVGVILLVLASTAFNRVHALDKISDHLVEGFVFAFRAMGPVIPIAGFFFLGSSDFTGSILSLPEDAAKPAFLVDIVQKLQTGIPDNMVFSAFGVLLVGMITGLEGSGFSGLPLVGALSGAMANTSGLDASTLGAIGQMGSVWTGGGTLIAWSSLVAVAGFCGVSVIELARKNFLPVVGGLIISTIVAIIIW